jgi:hypothetical protein
MLELILIIAAITAALSGFATYKWLTLKRVPVAAAQDTKAIGSAQPAAASNSGAPSPHRLEIEGAIHPKKGNFGFLKLFGLSYAPVYDLCYLPGPLSKDNLAPIVASTLITMHNDGDAVGTDVMDFIHHGKRLAQNEVLCFALLAKPRDTGYRIVAFVDKHRFPAPA